MTAWAIGVSLRHETNQVTQSLLGSVGCTSRNNFDDVCRVQYLLNCVPVLRGGPARELAVDGLCGPRTVRAIIGFERSLHGSGTGRIDPRRPIFVALLAYDPALILQSRFHYLLRGRHAVIARARLRHLAETTAFMRDVVLPGGPDARPALNPAACSFALRLGRSPIHRWGIFASEAIAAGLRVIEYTGERVSPEEAGRRSLRSQLYLFFLSPTQQIDGAIGGSGAQYINHSCEPNLRAAVSRRRLYLLSLRSIEAGEELLLDYRITSDGSRLPCHCGAASCRGYLNSEA